VYRIGSDIYAASASDLSLSALQSLESLQFIRIILFIDKNIADSDGMNFI